jgi:hypothetical protein
MKKIIFSFSCITTSLLLSMCDITNLDKKEVIKALYHYAIPHRINNQSSNKSLSDTDIENLLQYGTIEYLNDRILQIDVSQPYCDTFLYNQYNGTNRAETAIAHLKETIK